MAVTVHTMELGVTCCYLLVGSGGDAVLVDAGMPQVDHQVPAAFERIGISPEQIKLVVITHGHWDHVGCAQTLKQLTGARIAMHESERDRLEGGAKVMPPGVTIWGKVFGLALDAALLFMSVPPTPVDEPVADELPLSDYGISGRVIHTPGHSPGSLTVVLDSGEAFVGDSAVNGLPLSLGPSLPIFAEQAPRLAESWRRILGAGVHTAYPAHGKPFPISEMRRLVDA
jgi:glyoxylase-like metal-dependent hydrolase (beta-lactamase superfamily II)